MPGDVADHEDSNSGGQHRLQRNQQEAGAADLGAGRRLFVLRKIHLMALIVHIGIPGVVIVNDPRQRFAGHYFPGDIRFFLVHQYLQSALVTRQIQAALLFDRLKQISLFRQFDLVFELRD